MPAPGPTSSKDGLSSSIQSLVSIPALRIQFKAFSISFASFPLLQTQFRASSKSLLCPLHCTSASSYGYRAGLLTKGRIALFLISWVRASVPYPMQLIGNFWGSISSKNWPGVLGREAAGRPQWRQERESLLCSSRSQFIGGVIHPHPSIIVRCLARWYGTVGRYIPMPQTMVLNCQGSTPFIVSQPAVTSVLHILCTLDL
jgi:hypothetical protein